MSSTIARTAIPITHYRILAKEQPAATARPVAERSCRAGADVTEVSPEALGAPGNAQKRKRSSAPTPRSRTPVADSRYRDLKVQHDPQRARPSASRWPHACGGSATRATTPTAELAVDSDKDVQVRPTGALSLRLRNTRHFQAGPSLPLWAYFQHLDAADIPLAKSVG
jgi:hypothetical protein